MGFLIAGAALMMTGIVIGYALALAKFDERSREN